MRNRADGVYSRLDETLGHFNKHPRFVCLPAGPTCLSFLRLEPVVALSQGYSSNVTPQLPAPSVRGIYGKIRSACDGRECTGIGAPSGVLTLRRWYFCSIVKRLRNGSAVNLSGTGYVWDEEGGNPSGYFLQPQLLLSPSPSHTSTEAWR